MSHENTVTFVGNLTRDPELRFTPTGAAVCNFGVAVNHRRKIPNTNEWEDEPSFFDVVCWRDLAENVAESIGKGTRVVVTGRMTSRSYETQDGDKRTKVELTAEDVAASMRFATVAVARTERRDASSGPAERRAPMSEPGNPPAGAPPTVTYGPDEEPF